VRCLGGSPLGRWPRTDRSIKSQTYYHCNGKDVTGAITVILWLFVLPTAYRVARTGSMHVLLAWASSNEFFAFAKADSALR
jgi:hypothetical protein